MDRKNQNLYYIKILMGVINFIILSFLSAVFILTLNKINRDFGARNFLENITYLPNEPVTSTVLIFIVFFLLLGIIEIRRKQRKRQQVSVILYAAEILLCLIIIKFVYVNYNGIILLVIADIVTDIKDKHTRGIFFVIMGMIYLFSDYDIISMFIDMISFQQFLSVYPAKVSMMIQGTRNILVALNAIAFIAYMIILMRNQMKENARIGLLNLQLQTANIRLKEMNEQLKDYSQLVNAMGGEVINISATSDNHINAMDMNKDYGDGANPVILKSEFIMSLCEQLIGGTNLGAKQKSIIDRCTASVYRSYQQNDYQGHIPTLQDFRAELLQQDEPEAKELALAIELFTHGSLNTFAKQTNVDTNNRLICYDILDLGKQLMPIGMLVVLDSILNRITQNRAKGKNTFIFIDEIYLLFQHEYSANFLFTLWKRVRKYGAYASGITQNVDDLLQSHTARTMLANSEFIIMLNQASTDRLELAKLLNISDLQMSYITNVEAGHGLIKVGSSLVPFANKFPKNTKLYKLMTTKPGEA